MEPPEWPNEQRRLHTLHQYDILDTLPEACFDGIVELASNICETPIALFTLIDERRQWFKARVGVRIKETDRSVSFCAHAVACDAPLVIEDALKDPRFADNALVRGDPNIRFYAGIPIHANNREPLGTLCVIDHSPRSLCRRDLLSLQGLAREIESQLECRRISRSQQRLIEERAILTNMIVHDARNVFLVLNWSLEELQKEHGRENELIGRTRTAADSVAALCDRMAKLDDDRNRGLEVAPEPSDMRTWFDSVATRAKAAAKRANMKLNASFEFPDRMINTDTHLLERMIQNLCSNAMQSCDAGATISLHARLDDKNTMLFVVEDDGPGIETEIVEHIFEPYFSHRESTTRGTGLGLAICRLIAQTLGGDIEYVPRQPTGARFTISVRVN